MAQQRAQRREIAGHITQSQAIRENAPFRQHAVRARRRCQQTRYVSCHHTACARMCSTVAREHDTETPPQSGEARDSDHLTLAQWLALFLQY